MIVMKFGGSSVESGDAIARLVSTVRSELPNQPVVVVSALGKTTDKLLEFAEEAKRGKRYEASKILDEVQEHHFDVVEQVARGATLDWIERSLQGSFRDLRVVLFEIAEEGRELAPALRDEIASFGERMSSEIVVAALRSAGVDAVHLDARQLILTNDCHTNAKPLYWESYAKLRRAITPLAANRVVVLGGFIAATEAGVTTTLGRGGSDLTASIVGAGISADEIQIWTDVDGMLTCDPRVMPGGYRLKAISYEEAAALAGAGAKVLHPDTVKPAVRQRIPVVIRNSRRPEVEGTRVTERAPRCSNPVKAIACKRDVTVLELRQKTAGNSVELVAALCQMCERQAAPVEFVCQSSDAIFLALKNASSYRDLPVDLEGCTEVRLHPRSAVLTLVGAEAVKSPDLAARALSALKQIPAMLMADSEQKIAVSFVVPDHALERSVELLHREFFSQVDPSVFAPSLEAGFQSPQPFLSFVDSAARDSRQQMARLRIPLTPATQN